MAKKLKLRGGGNTLIVQAIKMRLVVSSFFAAHNYLFLDNKKPSKKRVCFVFDSVTNQQFVFLESCYTPAVGVYF